MSSSLSEVVFRTLRGLWMGALDDRRSLLALRGALYVIVIAAIAQIAADPVVREFASMSTMRVASEPALRNRILDAWAALGLLPSASLYLWIDALASTPAMLIFFIAFLHYYDNRLCADGTRPLFGRLAWPLLLVAPVCAFLVGELGIAASLWGLHSRPPAAWLHVVVRWTTVGARGLNVVAIGECLWLFSSWFFLSPVDSRGASPAAAAERAKLRAAIADMVWRSKYALAIVLFYGALVLGMDQTRDALLRQVVDATGAGPGYGWLQTGSGILVTIAALVLLARASWLWPRMILRLRSADARSEPPQGAEAFAKWWCRILGVVPYVFVATMIANTVHDVPPGHVAVRWLVVALALVLVFATLFLLRVSLRGMTGSAHIGYYQRAIDRGAARSDLGLMPLLVGWGAPITFLLARAAAVWTHMPPLVLVVVTAALATWAGILGWVAYQSRRYAIPFLLLFVAWVGIAGYFDLTDAHRLRTLDGDGPAFDPATLFPTVLLLFAICACVAWYWQRRTATGIGRAVAAAIAATAILAVIHLHDGRRESHEFADTRMNFDQAVSTWERGLPADAWKEPGQRTADGGYPVFIVTSEGGGIRSAYWTAIVLWRLHTAIPDFDRRTFALSGTSGGALGMAVYRACILQNPDSKVMRQCIERFGSIDLWTQLLGGMFFEDALAAVIPTRQCVHPGCGVLGRSYWFEGAMEVKVPALAEGLVQTAQAGAPHIFLNVTRAETGERAIESDIRVSEADFPDAPDLITAMQADMRLSTAAHNSARFPFTNPVGALYGPDCAPDAVAGPAAITPGAAKAAGGAPPRRLCMRLQDGGYFDNSGALTGIDILRGLSSRLDAWRCGQASTSAGAPSQCASAIVWVKPVVIEIRNTYTETMRPGTPAPPACVTPAGSPVDPGRALTVPPLLLYPSVITALITSYATRDAHMRNFEGELERVARSAWASLGFATPVAQPTHCPAGTAQWIGNAPIHRFDLVNNGILYPSGWLLSQAARDGIALQAAYSVPCTLDAVDKCDPSVARK